MALSLRRHSAIAALLALVVPLLVVALGSTARAQPAPAPRPDAGAPAALGDDSGPAIEPRALPPPGAATWPRACSFRLPICVHGAPGTERRIVTALEATERAWGVATGAMQLPPPDPDPLGAYRVYLVDAAPAGASTHLSERDVLSSFDRASAFTLLDRALSGCALEAALAREVARASLWRVSPAMDGGTARATTAYLARLMVPCAAGALDGVDFFQRHPERPIPDTWRERAAAAGDEFDRGAALFYWWLDATFGQDPGSLVRGLWALTPTVTPLGSWSWNDQPDGFAVLRATFAQIFDGGLDELLVNFAIARAAPSGAIAETRTLGAAADVELWDVKWPKELVWLESTRGVGPTGATYIRVPVGGLPKGSRLRVQAVWESFTRMRWVAVKLDASGRELSRFVLPAPDRATQAIATVYELDEVASLLIVGVSLGDFQFPFDPDDVVWEPHGWLLGLRAE